MTSVAVLVAAAEVVGCVEPAVEVFEQVPVAVMAGEDVGLALPVELTSPGEGQPGIPATEIIRHVVPAIRVLEQMSVTVTTSIKVRPAIAAGDVNEVTKSHAEVTATKVIRHVKPAIRVLQQMPITITAGQHVRPPGRIAAANSDEGQTEVTPTKIIRHVIPTVGEQQQMPITVATGENVGLAIGVKIT